MMMLSTPHASPVSNANERANAAQSASVEASAHAAFDAERRAGAANEAKVAATTAQAATAHAVAAVPDVTQSLSTIAVVGALSSVPAALSLMNSIVTAAASGTLTEADLEKLQSEYAQLRLEVVSAVGSAAAGAETSSSTAHDRDKDDHADDADPETSDDRRSTVSRTVVKAAQYVQHEPVDQVVTTMKSTLVPDGNPVRKNPFVTIRTHELHVGTDSYEPVSTRQTQTRLTTPATFGRLEQHVETHHTFVAQARQITEFAQVSQVALVPVLSTVA
jgi:flagellin-like hook-associated protein FlgL